MNTDVDIRGAFRERVLSGLVDARSGRGWVLFLLNELVAARRLRYKWAWIHAKLVELDIQISLRNLRDIYASVKEHADEDEVGKLVAMAGGSMTLLRQPASPSARPKTSEIEEKAAEAYAFRRNPLGGAMPHKRPEPNSGAAGENTDCLPLGNSGSGWSGEVLGTEKSK